MLLAVAVAVAMLVLVLLKGAAAMMRFFHVLRPLSLLVLAALLLMVATVLLLRAVKNGGGKGGRWKRARGELIFNFAPVGFIQVVCCWLNIICTYNL